jgi:hypothetical protein
MTSQGEWDACATCGTFINEGRWDMLLNHCDDMKRNAESVLPRSVQRALHELRADIHRRFKAHRCGDGVPQPPSPFGH